MNLPVSESYTTIAGFLMAEAGKLLGEGASNLGGVSGPCYSPLNARA